MQAAFGLSGSLLYPKMDKCSAKSYIYTKSNLFYNLFHQQHNSLIMNMGYALIPSISDGIIMGTADGIKSQSSHA